MAAPPVVICNILASYWHQVCQSWSWAPASRAPALVPNQAAHTQHLCKLPSSPHSSEAQILKGKEPRCQGAPPGTAAAQRAMRLLGGIMAGRHAAVMSVGQPLRLRKPSAVVRQGAWRGMASTGRRPRKAYDAIIIGGGVIGNSCALELARAGKSPFATVCSGCSGACLLPVAFHVQHCTGTRQTRTARQSSWQARHAIDCDEVHLCLAAGPRRGKEKEGRGERADQAHKGLKS